MKFYTAVYDALPEPSGGGAGAEGFFLAYLAVPVVILFYIAGFIWKRATWVKIADIDIDSGRRAIDQVEHDAMRAKKAQWSGFRRFMDRIF